MENIKNKIDRLAGLAAGWETHEAIDPLERDLALELLREIYSDIKFAKQAVDAVPVPVAEPVSEPVAEQAPAPAAEAVVEEEQVIEPEPETSEEPEPVAEPETSEEPEPLPEPEPAPEAEEIPVRHRRVDPEVIRSLYGDDGPAMPAAKEEPEMPAPAEITAEEKPSERLPENEKPAATLGDVMNAGRQTLGEALHNGKKDMASKIAASERRELKQSIGINDKFLMVRDMFDGDADAFNDAIAHLDTFTDLDEAIIYIHDTYDWSADSEGVKLLVELLERKLG